jgi:hypothetical protein
MDIFSFDLNLCFYARREQQLLVSRSVELVFLGRVRQGQRVKIRGESNESSGPTKISDVDCNKVKHENHEIVDFYTYTISIYIYTIYII